jgi:hypothetical protein
LSMMKSLPVPWYLKNDSVIAVEQK